MSYSQVVHFKAWCTTLYSSLCYILTGWHWRYNVALQMRLDRHNLSTFHMSPTTKKMPSLPQTESENSEKSIQHIVMEACFSSVAFGRQGLTCHRGSYVASQTLLSVIREGIWGSENPFVLDRMGVRYKWTEMERLVAHSQPTVEGKPWVFLWVFFSLFFLTECVRKRIQDCGHQ